MANHHAQRRRRASREQGVVESMPPTGPGGGGGAKEPGWWGYGPRRWLWRLFAAVGVTSAVLLLTEATLRVAGYGFPTAFFLPAQVEGREVFLNNPVYGWRFFPPALARECWPFAVPAQKDPGTCRIFVFGESAAMGDPDPRFGLSRMIEALLSQRFPDRRFEVVNVAFTAINSHVILPIARECSQHDGDLWIIYAGNNEVAGPFGPATVFGSQSPPLPVIRANLALKTTRLGQFLDSLLGGLGKGAPRAEQWRGLEMLLGNEMRPSDPRLQAVYANYRRNLIDIVRAGRRANARVLLCTMGTNLRDCAPFASMHREGIAGAELAEWETAYQVGVARRQGGDMPGAIEAFGRALALDEEYAELHFRMAECRLASGQVPVAAEHYRRARDADALRLRADTRINEITLEIGRQAAGPGLWVFDAEGYLAQRSPNGLPGGEFLFDHVHLAPAGTYLLARGIAEQAVGLLALGESAGGEEDPARDTSIDREDAREAGGWASAEHCRVWLGLTDWNLFSLYGRVLSRMQSPPFSQQLSQPAEMRRWGQQQLGLRWSGQPAQVTPWLEGLREGVQRRPSDADLRSNYAALLATAGDLPGAEREWRRVIEILPHAVQGWVGLGRVIEAQGRREEAVQCYRTALGLLPHHPQAKARLDGLSGESSVPGGTAQRR